jgi:MiaB-like tRNA modifying enzyme
MRIGILTYGCSVNKSDSELMATLLADAGFDVVLESEKPKLLLINTCIVKGPTENKILRKLEDLRAAGKRVIVAGCMPEAYPNLLKRFPEFSVVGINCFDVVGVVKSYLENCSVTKTDGFEEKVLPKKVKYNDYVDIVPISEGCLGYCTYCATRFARGKLRSYSPDAIVGEITASVNCGAKEIWLTSQDNGCYGFDIGTNLAELLKQVVEIPGDFRVRVGMANPSHMRGFLKDLVEVFKHEKIFKFLHIPVQAGSDKVLKEMKRGYTTKDFESIVFEFRKAMDITISTDIIVGFPTEFERDFEQTMTLLERVRPDFLNLSKYWPRKKTEAGEMKQLPREVVAARSKNVADLFSKTLKEKNKSWVGQECSVTFIEKKGEYYVGRNSLYRPVLVKGKDLLGRKCSVKIKATKASELIGRLS